MTNQERLSELLNGRIPDRVPIICNMFDQGAIELDLSLREYYSKGKNVARGQLTLLEKYESDFVWAFFHMASIAQLAGCRNIIFPKEGTPNVGQTVIPRISEAKSFTFPRNIINHEDFREWRKCIEILVKEAGPSTPVVSAVVGTFTLPSILMGMEKWLEMLLFGDPEEVRILLSHCSDFVAELILSLKELGVDVIAYTDPMSSADFFSRDQFLKFAMPWIEKDIQAAGADRVVYFCGGGKIGLIIEDIMAKTDLRAFYISPLDNITKAKQAIQGKGILIAPINDILLFKHSEEIIEQEIERIMSEGKDGGGFMFGTLMMPYAIPESNINYMIQSAKKLGRY